MQENPFAVYAEVIRKPRWEGAGPISRSLSLR